jgi:hypothetical protein
VTAINLFDLNGKCNYLPTDIVSQKLGSSKVGSETKSYRRHYSSKDIAPWASAPARPGQKKLGDSYVLDSTFCDIGIPYIDWINRQEVRDAFKIPNVV